LLGLVPHKAQHGRLFRLGEGAVIVTTDELAPLREIEGAGVIEYDVGDEIALRGICDIDLEARVVGEAAV